jgi:hypothetical protein
MLHHLLGPVFVIESEQKVTEYGKTKILVMVRVPGVGILMSGLRNVSGGR